MFASSPPSSLPHRGTIQLGDLTIELETHTLYRGSEAISIGSRAFDILVVLAIAEGRLVTKDELMAAVWPNTVVEENNIQVHLSSLRKIFRAGRNLIVTVPGRGYRLVRPEPNGPATLAKSAAEPDGIFNTRASCAGLIGREDEIERALDLPRTAPLVTIVGAGGVGKSSLAREVACRFAAELERPARHVELATTRDREGAIEALSKTLAPGSGSVSADIGELAWSSDRDDCLLLIDNAEHLIADVADIAHRLASANRRMRILITSREPLRITSETVFRLGPLGVPFPGAADAEIAAAPAVKLLRERANAHQQGLADDSNHLQVMADICRRLSGYPLAIELAEARLPALGFKDIHERLDDQLSILVGGYRTALPRHRSLRASFDWSYSLLTADQAAVFRRTGVFITPFTFHALCSVASDTSVSMNDVINCASDLVAKSLLSVQFDGAVARYKTTEFARSYGLAKLSACGEAHTVRAHHAHFVADRLSLFAAGDEQRQELLNETFIEAHNALDWAFSIDGDLRAGIDLSSILVDVCLRNGMIEECARYASQALDVLANFPDAVVSEVSRMRLMAALASALPHVGGNIKEVEDVWLDVLERAVSANDSELHLRALYGLWDTCITQGRIIESESIALRVRLRVQSKGSEWQVMLADLIFALSLHCLARHEEAKLGLTDAVDRLMRLRQQTSGSETIPIEPLVFCSGTLARIVWLQGQSAEAISVIEALVVHVLPQTQEPTIPHVLGAVVIPLAMLAGDLAKTSDYLDIMHSHSKQRKLTHWLEYADALRGCHNILAGEIRSGLSVLETAIQNMLMRGYRRMLTPRGRTSLRRPY